MQRTFCFFNYQKANGETRNAYATDTNSRTRSQRHKFQLSSQNKIQRKNTNNNNKNAPSNLYRSTRSPRTKKHVRYQLVASGHKSKRAPHAKTPCASHGTPRPMGKGRSAFFTRHAVHVNAAGCGVHRRMSAGD